MSGAKSMTPRLEAVISGDVVKSCPVTSVDLVSDSVAFGAAPTNGADAKYTLKQKLVGARGGHRGSHPPQVRGEPGPFGGPELGFR